MGLLFPVCMLWKTSPNLSLSVHKEDADFFLRRLALERRREGNRNIVLGIL